jgi:FkbM family methyltransferase
MTLITICRKVVLKLKIEARFFKKRFDTTIVKSETINKNYIRKFLPPNPVIIDAGAHAGGDSVEMCRLYTGSVIHAFEPVPSVFKLLQHNTRKFKQIHCHAIALSNQNGQQTMHVSSGASDGSSSLLAPKEHLTDHPDVFFKQTITVVTKTLDTWAAEQNLSRIDMLWLDMQGFELEVLKASNVILPTVKVIHMEVSTRATYEGVPLYDEVKTWMQSKGFKVEVEAIPQGWDMGNVLFVRAAEKE